MLNNVRMLLSVDGNGERMLPLANPLNRRATEGDMQELREVKVKLPVEQVMQLHYLRMKNKQTFSEVMRTALARYMRDVMRG